MLELDRLAPALLLALFYLGFCWWCFYRHQRNLPRNTGKGDGRFIIAYASQSGRAHNLANSLWQGLAEQPILLPLNQLNIEKLQNADTLLVVASTYGEGEAPDNGTLFESKVLNSSATLSLRELRYAVIALGDSSYADFCGFGRRINRYLQETGAKALTPILELDAERPKEEAQALTQVKVLVQSLGGDFDSADPEHQVLPQKHTVHLLAREQLNQGSSHAPLYHIQLQANEALNYQAGDIVDIYPRQRASTCQKYLAEMGIDDSVNIDSESGPIAALSWLASRQLPKLKPADKIDGCEWLQQLPEIHPRQYTIANAHHDKGLELVVRLQTNATGETGLASGWLTQTLNLNDEIDLVLRDNQEFHTPPAKQPLILIGNGSGIAGLRAHIQHRATTKGEPCWLIYGERDPDSDLPFVQELSEYEQQGIITQTDRVFSQSTAKREYVQDRLAAKQDTLRDWLARGACLYVCGSRQGMAEGVHQCLQEILGTDELEQLHLGGRYRRDVY